MESTLQIQRTSFKALKTKCEDVEFGDPIALQKIGVELMNLLVGTSYHSLAINQCGLTYRIFCSRVNNTFTTYYNKFRVIIHSQRIITLNLLTSKRVIATTFT